MDRIGEEHVMTWNRQGVQVGAGSGYPLPPTHPLVERLRNFFYRVPGVSPQQFLLEALRRELDRREQTLDGNRPWPPPRRLPFGWQSPYRPEPAATLPPALVHEW